MHADVSTIEVSGEIDRGLMRELCALIGSLIDENRTRVVLDFSRVEHLHYQGIALLTERAKQLRSLGGDLRIVGVSPYVRDIFRALDAERLFQSRVPLDTAMGWIPRTAATAPAPSP
jgi:anti-anti-sigma factor